MNNTKICKSCGEEKELKYFGKRSSYNHKDGLQVRCKECINLQIKSVKDLNREEVKRRAKEYYNKNKERILELLKFNRLLTRYNLTREKYEEILIKQNFSCAICKNRKYNESTKLHVDHCHKTGNVRGLLCNTCNIALGGFKDNIEYLESAIKYLKENNTNE